MQLDDNFNSDLLKNIWLTTASSTTTLAEVSSAPSNTPKMKEKPVSRVLLVDDDIVDRKTIQRLLNAEQHTYQIDEAASREEALELFAVSEYDCILLDFRLGNSDALEMLPELKQLSSDGRVAIVLVTGMGNERLAAQAFKAGVHDYVVKSNLQGDILFAALEHAMRSVRLERENERQRSEIEFFSLHDHLTGMPNRKLFHDRLEQAILHAQRSGVSFSVCSMDLDRFKRINDTLGHDVGDQVLVEIASRMIGALRSSDTVARFGGDEFVALLDIPDIQGAVAVAEKLVACVAEPIIVNKSQVGVGLSIGISTFSETCHDSRELLKKADQAMYAAKKSSSGIVVSSGDNLPQAQRAMDIATEISSIVESDTLIMEYQPQINLSTNQVVGVEALVRWRHPSLGLLPPVEFIPVVERTQKIIPMTFHITELAIKQCSDWRACGYDIPISVNLSSSVLDVASLPRAIEMQLHKWDLPAEFLTLEVTETGALESLKAAANILYELSLLGVKISIDDFGSGYTSFRYLREFTVHELKIDRLFVEDLVKGQRDESIIKSMLELGKGFDVKMVAEGIGNEETLERLKAIGCEYGQGYYFSKSLSANVLLDWVSQWNITHQQTS